MTRRPTALIADDEEPMREMLRARLASTWPELQIAGEAGNGMEAVALANALEPDVVFLDIRMPGLSGIEAARLVSGRSHVVFVTAYDEFAVQAFEKGAADYLLKPVDAARLSLACTRLKARLEQAPPALDDLLAQLLRRPAATGRHLQWIQAAVGGSVRMIPVREVLFFRAEEKYTRVQTHQAQALIRLTLKELEDQVDPAAFWRIHRSTLVRVGAIADVVRDGRGRQVVRLRDHDERLEVSRACAHLFQQM